MDSLDAKVKKECKIYLPIIGDWELDTSDPLSPLYEPSIGSMIKNVIVNSVCIPIKNLYGSIKSRYFSRECPKDL